MRGMEEKDGVKEREVTTDCTDFTDWRTGVGWYRRDGSTGANIARPIPELAPDGNAEVLGLSVLREICVI
jgi:hypothetical protein